ncbi:hypothetical protein M569_13665 [Genlisea aurea]|uniref:Uncharacterized protein n=1 Tax=Genlisea aurea TaxID=192259 RepID=S8C3A4_9LAMI|nr:hypothetical protein M569_13665 [Genlisea aurea]
MESSSVAAQLPSFNSYSNDRFSEIADRVVEELGYGEVYIDGDSDEFEEELEGGKVFGEEEEDDDEDFEFEVVAGGSGLPAPISADEIFVDGKIRPIYPVFGRDLLMERFGESRAARLETDKAPAVRVPLRKLFISERESSMTLATTSSCSSSEADDLDGVPADSYCVWQPKESADDRCKKSHSTGSHSKRWRLKMKELLNRSHSESSQNGVVLIGLKSSARRKQSDDGAKSPPTGEAKLKSPPATAPPCSNRTAEKRRSYLPYKQVLFF